MDDLRNLSSGQNAAFVILAFLQADCNVRNVEYGKEIFSLGKELTWDTNCNVRRIDVLNDGDLETDGHLPSSLTLSLDDIQPSVELHSE